MDVTLEEAYREACLALGEQIVKDRLAAKYAAQAAASETQEAGRES